jgi:hypothetical protein
MSAVTLELDAETAAIFENATEPERRKLCALRNLLLREYRSGTESLPSHMDEIGEKARSRGLTSEKLESILNAGGQTPRS